MIYLIIGTTIGAIIGFLQFCDKNETLIERLALLISKTILGLGCGIAVLITIGLIIGCFLPTKYVTTKTTNILALKDNTETSGSFFLGCGTVEGETVYKYVVETKDGKQVKEIKDDNSATIYIREYEGKQKIEYKELEFVNKNNYWFACLFDKKSKIIFYIPKGSVTNEFNINLE